MAGWGLASALRPSAQAAKLFVAFGTFNSLISIFLSGNAVHQPQGSSRALEWFLIAILNVNILIRLIVNERSSLPRVLTPLLQR